MSDDTEGMEMAEAAEAEAVCAASPSVISASTSGEGCVASVPAADVAVVVVLSATLRRMYERKEDMCPAVGGAAATGTGSVSTATPTPVVEVAVAVVPATISMAVSGEREAARIVAVEVAGTVASPLASEGTIGKWGVELPPAPVSR